MTTESNAGIPQADNARIVEAINRSSGETAEAIRSMAQDLKEIFQQTGTEANRLLEDLKQSTLGVQSSVQALGDLVDATSERTIAEIKRSAYLSGQMEVAKQKAELDAIDPDLANQNQDLEQQHTNTNNRMDRIGDKYGDIADELEDSYDRDIRRLGGYIYNIVENEYGSTVAQQNEAPGFQLMANTTRQNTDERETALGNQLELIHEAGRSYVDTYNQLERELRSHELARSVPAIQGEQVAVPFWVVTVENAQGEEETWVIPPSSVIADEATEGEIVSGTPIGGYGELHSLLEERIRQIAEQKVTWRPHTEEERERLESGLERLHEDGMIGPIMLDFVKQALGDRVPQLGEGVQP